MKSFNISEIKIKSDPKNQPSLERKLTDEVITSLDPKTGVLPNAELEGGEYMRFPDGLIQKAAGNKHSKGGLKMNIPDGTKILSDKLKLTRDQAQRLNDEFDIKLSAKDTYASAQSKYDKAVGLTKLYDEQEQLFKELSRQQKKDLSDGTKRINDEYLSSKISEIEKQKAEKEGVRDEFFNRAFSLQEAGKVKENKEGNFAYGGLSMQNYEALCKKHGIDPVIGKALLKGTLMKFEEGGEKDLEKYREELKKLDPEGKYATIEDAKTAFDAGTLSAQSYDNIENLLWNIQNAEKRVAESQVEGVDYDKPAGTGVRTKAPYEEAEGYTPKGVKRLNQFRNKYGLDPIDESSTKAEIKKAAGELQSHMGDNYSELVYDYMMNKSHKPNKKLERHLKELGYDPTNEGLKKAVDEGKLTKDDVVGDYQDDLWWYRALDTETKKIPRSEYEKLLDREGAIKQGDDLYFAEDPSNPELYTKYEPIDPEGEEKKPPVASGEEIVDDLRPPVAGLPAWYNIPEQRPLPPSPMDAHMLAQARLGRIDPIRVGIEPQIQQSGERMKFVAEQASELPDSQKFAVLANAQASEAKSLNAAITQANMWNAQAQQQAKLFNVGQADREGMLKNQYLLDFERRQLTAKAKTEEDYRNYFKELKRQRAHDYYTRQNLSMIDAMTPDYTFTGMDWAYTPEGEWRPRRNDYRELVSQGYINKIT